MSTLLRDRALSRNASWAMYLPLFKDKKRATPLPLTGYSAKCQMKDAEGSAGNVVATPTITIGTLDETTMVFTANPDGNALQLILTRAQVAAITVDTVYADILIGPTGSSDPKRAVHFKAVVGDGETSWT